MSATPWGQPPWPTPQTFCRRCRKERRVDLEAEGLHFPVRVDFAGGHHELCAACWQEWISSPVFLQAAASPCPDRNALGWWLEGVRP